MRQTLDTGRDMALLATVAGCMLGAVVLGARANPARLWEVGRALSDAGMQLAGMGAETASRKLYEYAAAGRMP